MTTTQTEDDRRRYDREDLLRDGEVLRVPLLLRDAAQEGVAAITRKALADAYPSTSGALHRPGTLISDGVQAELAATEREVRRDLRLDELSNAWKNPPPQDHQAPVQQDQDSVDAEVRLNARKRKLEAAWQLGMGSGPDRRSA